MQRAHKIKLQPNNVQATYFAKACGCARFTFNWALAEWKRQYEAGEKPSAYSLKKLFNAIKLKDFPWVKEVTKCAPEAAFMQIEQAFKRFFRKTGGYPRFKKKNVQDAFYISNQHFKLNGKMIFIPKLGWVRMREPLRFEGKVQSAVVSKNAAGWFVAISEDTSMACLNESQVQTSVGVDLGIKYLAVTSDGEYFPNPKSTSKFKEKLKRLNKSLARKVKGSCNWKKAKQKLGVLHYKISSVRKDASHKLTHFLATRYSDVCVEDLSSSGMLKNRSLSKAVADASFYEIRRQLVYKCKVLHVIDRWFPSTKLCPACGQLNTMPLGQRVYACSCGYGPIDRDLNAAINILRQGLPGIKTACGPVISK